MGNKADAKAAFARLRESLGEIAAVRQGARDNGLELPEDIRQSIIRMRGQLLVAGLSPQQIDATPGLEPEGL